jgi:hypothetical protein
MFGKIINIKKYLCKIIGHRFPCVWLKTIHLNAKKGEGVMVAYTPAGCKYCGKTFPFSWWEQDVDWKRSNINKKGK